MYQDEYKRWLAADLEDPDLKPELLKIADDDEAIKERSRTVSRSLSHSEPPVFAGHSAQVPTA